MTPFYIEQLGLGHLPFTNKIHLSSSERVPGISLRRLVVRRGRWVVRSDACCLRQNIQTGRTSPRRSSVARFWDNGRGGTFIPAGRVVRVDPLQLLAQLLFHPSACARQVFHMSILPLLCAVIRALEILGAHPAGLVAQRPVRLRGGSQVSGPSRPVSAPGPRPGSPLLPQFCF